MDWRKPYIHYMRGSVSKLEHAKLIDTLREAAWMGEKPVFIEVGVWVAKTSRMMLQVLGQEMRPCHMICTDISIKAQARFRKQCGSTAHFTNVKREYVKGGMKAVLNRLELQPNSVTWAFIDGCHCFDCCSGDIRRVRDLILPGGFLLIHDTDPRHKDGPADQRYHGDKRPFGVLKAIEDARLEVDFSLEEEIPGEPAELRPIRCGMRVYRKLLDETPKMEIEVTVSEGATSLIDGAGGSIAPDGIVPDNVLATPDVAPDDAGSRSERRQMPPPTTPDVAPEKGGDRVPNDAPD